MKWAVELLGKDIDLQDALALFAGGRIRVETIEHNKTVLVADDFEPLTDRIEVRGAAKAIVDLINGALFLHDSARSPIQVGSVCENCNGNWKTHHIIEPQTAVFRTKFHPARILMDGKPAPAKPSSKQKWLEAAASDDVVVDVFSYLRDAKPDWFEFYKAFERMRDDINRGIGAQQKEESMGWPTKTELNNFTESANVHRHSPPKSGRLRPTTAMKIEDARAFIRRLTQIWLDWQIK